MFVYMPLYVPMCVFSANAMGLSDVGGKMVFENGI